MLPVGFFFVFGGTEIEFVSLRNGCLHFHELCLGSLFSIVWGPQLGTSCNKAHTHTSMYVYNCLYHLYLILYLMKFLPVAHVNHS